MFFGKVSLVTGGFDPIHSGHISYFERAKDLSGYLVVGLNTEEWLTRKKGQYFQSWKERAEIIRHLDMVDAVISYDDSDDSSCEGISRCLDIAEKVVFCNGGDRADSNTPEEEFCSNNSYNLTSEYNIGGSKTESSSVLINNASKIQRESQDELKKIDKNPNTIGQMSRLSCMHYFFFNSPTFIVHFGSVFIYFLLNKQIKTIEKR